MQNSPARLAIDVGTVIDGTYTIERLIGRGGMGEVFLAGHNRLAGKFVAIKMLHPDLEASSGGTDILARFKREADIAAQLDHPNIVKVEDYKLLPDGTPYIVYEYLQGESLAQRLKNVGALPVDQTLSILRQVGSALSAAHRAGIVHRDLKPQNIFLCPSEVEGRATEQAKVLDFGISKLRGSNTVKTQESSLLGTPQYMAPEQATGQHSIVDERTDIFALGAIVYDMLAGRPAFTGTSIPEIVFKVVYEQPAPLSDESPPLPAAIVAAVVKAMQKAPDDRFANVPAFIEALTGAPLSVMRRPTTSMPPGERHSSAGDAFAKTMDSGDGSIPVATVTAPAPVLGSAPTVSSQTSPAAKSDVAVVPARPAPAHRSRALIAGLVVATGALVAIVMYFAMRGRGEGPAARSGSHESITTRHDERPRVDHDMKPEPVERDPAPVKPEVRGPVKPSLPVANPGKDPTPTKAPVKADPKQPDARVDPKKDPVKDDDVGGDETSAAKLKDAEAALRDKHYQVAERLANAVLSSDVAVRFQKARGYAIRGIVACVVHNSEEDARIALRELSEFPRFRRRVITACHAEDHLMSEN